MALTGQTENENTLKLEGTPNFRDLGGLVARDGRAVRTGMLFRTEGPEFLTGRDSEKLRACGIRLVCDLRSEGERHAAPNSWCEGMDVEILESGGAVDLRARNNDAWEALRADPSARGARRAVIHNYRAMPWALAVDLRRLIDGMLVHGRLPALIHCTAGKDRTGFVVAMLLLALDIPRDTVFEDYLLSARHMTDRFHPSVRDTFRDTFGYEPSPETLAAMTGIDSEYLAASLASVEEESGSLETYFAENMGLTGDKQSRLRDLLLDGS